MVGLTKVMAQVQWVMVYGSRFMVILHETFNVKDRKGQVNTKDPIFADKLSDWS